MKKAKIWGFYIIEWWPEEAPQELWRSLAFKSSATATTRKAGTQGMKGQRWYDLVLSRLRKQENDWPSYFKSTAIADDGWRSGIQGGVGDSIEENQTLIRRWLGALGWIRSLRHGIWRFQGHPSAPSVMRRGENCWRILMNNRRHKSYFPNEVPVFSLLDK